MDTGSVPEVMNPRATDSTSLSGEFLTGVPARYRAAAEAYFKRLAEESR